MLSMSGGKELSSAFQHPGSGLVEETKELKSFSHGQGKALISL